MASGMPNAGFKAVRTAVAKDLVPRIEDNGWFFDTELLALASHDGLRINEVPVRWIDDEDSRVRIVKTATEDLKGILRLRRADQRGSVMKVRKVGLSTDTPPAQSYPIPSPAM